MYAIRFHRSAAFVLFALILGTVGAQPPADKQAELLLNVARKAYADANPQLATEKFREFVSKFGGHKDANSARLGLAIALLDLPERNYQQALDTITPAANDGGFTDRALALYYSGVSRRGLGQKELDGTVTPQRQQNANAHFTEAAKFFASARDAFEKKSSPDADWAARCRCDTAEMELRLGKAKEARATAEPFLKDAALVKSKFRALGLYYHGFAAFLLNDIPAAGKSLNQLAPFDQPFGLHARYLMGRIHEKSEEKAEAAAAFTAVLAGYEIQQKAAAEALKQPDRFKNDPWERARLEALVKAPPPDYVAGAAFYGACLNYEAGKFGEALPKFQAFAKEYTASSFKADATLRAGFCLVQMKSFDDAVKTLQPLVGNAELGDQAMYWLGKAQFGQALAVDPANPNLRNQAINSLRGAADKAKQLANQGDAEAKARYPEILLDLADSLLTAKLAPQAALTYDQLANEKLLPAKAEEILQRSVTAYHLAEDTTASEARVATFKKQYPNSPLLPLVLFRSAENSFTVAEKLAKQHNPTAKATYSEAAKKYEELIAKFPEFERVNRTRYELARCLTANEDWDKATAVLEAIPIAERSGDLAPVSYVLADCLLRTAPAKAEDALQDNILREKLAAAATLLESFVAANPKSAEAADALLKIGLCYKRLGIQLAPGKERDESLQKARAVLERLPKDFAQSPLVGAATLERAKVLALQGDKANAVKALQAFSSDPLQRSPVAPLAAIALATLLREQNQLQPAVDVMKQARDKYEQTLMSDPVRIEWVALLRYHHGVALFEAGKHIEARTAFDQVTGNRQVIVEATLKSLQCSVEHKKKQIADIEKEKAKPGLALADIAPIENRLKIAKGELLGFAKQFETRANQLRADFTQSEVRARMYYEAAWLYRSLATDPTSAYKQLIAEFPDLSLAVEARLELAELAVEQGKPDDAVKLLKEAIDKEPIDKPTPGETLERVRLRLGAILFDKKDYAAAQGQFDAVAANEKSPHRAQGLYRSAECLMAQSKFDAAAKKFIIFRDNAAFHNIADVSNRALLRLGHAYLELKQWEPARQTFELQVQRYGPNNPWAIDARYGLGLVLQNQGRYDDAVNAYAIITQATQDERSGRARLQIGECRAKQNKWKEAGAEFQTVYYGYDIPELKFTAMLEHARVLIAEQKPDDAVKLLDRVIRDAPKDSEWTKAAQERLEKMKK